MLLRRYGQRDGEHHVQHVELLLFGGLMLDREQKREKECPNRRGGCCDLINTELGWRHGCPLDDCDRCWGAEGGWNGKEAARIRKALVDSWREAVLKNLWAAPKDVLRALLRGGFLSRDQALRYLSNPEALWNMNREVRWAAVRSTWEMAVSFGRSLASRGFMGRRAPPSVVEERMRSCFGDGKDVGPCPALRRSGADAWCGECGCGPTKIALLTRDDGGYSKLEYPYLECPRGMPGFSNAGEVVPLTIKEVPLP